MAGAHEAIAADEAIVSYGWMLSPGTAALLGFVCLGSEWGV